MAKVQSSVRKATSFVFFVFFIFGAHSLSGQSSKNPPVTQANGEATPNLVPLLHRPMNEEIRVRNLGAAPAAPSKLTLDCESVGTEVAACPDLPPWVADVYFDPMFPKHATIKVPALAPGANFTHRLSFWSAMNWQKGKYKVTEVVHSYDPAQEVFTGNKVAVSILTIP